MPYSVEDHKNHFQKSLKEHRNSLEQKAKEKFELLKPIIFETLNEDIENHFHVNREYLFYKQRTVDKDLKDLSVVDPHAEYIKNLFEILGKEFPMFEFLFTFDNSGRYVVMRIIVPDMKK